MAIVIIGTSSLAPPVATINKEVCRHHQHQLDLIHSQSEHTDDDHAWHSIQRVRGLLKNAVAKIRSSGGVPSD